MIHYAEYDGGYEGTAPQPEIQKNIQYIDEGDAIFLVPSNTKISAKEKIQLARSVPKNILTKIEDSLGMYMHTFPSHPIMVAYYFDRNAIPGAYEFMQQTMQEFLADQDLPENAIVIGLII